MNSRWLLLGFGLLFGAVTIGFVYQEKTVLALIAAVHAVFGFGGYWWNTSRDDPIETRWSRSG